MFDLISPESPICFEFSKENLLNLIQTSQEAEILEHKNQVNYLFDYLSEIGCQTIVFEQKYIDKFYLDDYLHFYSTCFKNYNKICQRLHFFSKPITIEDLLNPDNDKSKSLNDSYLGFSVIKPIPNLVGRTLLRVYPETNSDIEFGNCIDQRHITTLSKFTANLFGNDLEIMSLPFQEQDQIISACATSALWTVLQKTAKDYGYYVPTPFEITSAANKNLPINRPLPSSGLTITQVIGTIKSFGMDVEVVELKQKKVGSSVSVSRNALIPENFLAFCYAYLRGGFPIFLGVKIAEEYHALALLGYHLGTNQVMPSKLALIGNKIDKFYMHDDNFGPFTKYEVKSNEKQGIFLLTKNRQPIKGLHMKVIPDTIVIPLYHKIRFPFSEIRIILNQISGVIRDYQLFKNFDKMEWDCFLTEINDFKKEVLHSTSYKALGDVWNRILLGYLPRFFWRIILYYSNVPIMELWADATEAQTNSPLINAIFYDSLFRVYFKSIINEHCKEDLSSPGLYSFFRKSLDLE